MVVIGVSGGPDSMALLDMERKRGTDLVVCHVNYHKRDTAVRDEGIVREYCAKYGIELRILCPHHVGHDNFQAWARKVRYDFFVDVAGEFGADAILVAHQEDDLLETYLFQRERGMLCDWYGLRWESQFGGVKVRRPLLKYSKADLEEYCIANGIAYGFDESNGSDVYARNRIRHHVLPAENRGKLRAEIARQNIMLIMRRRKARKRLAADGLDWLNEDDGWFLLDVFVSDHGGFHLGRRELESLVGQLQGDHLVQVHDFWLERRKGSLRMERVKSLVPVSFESVGEMLEYEGSEFCFRTAGTSMERISLSDDDFPVMVRAARPGDEVSLRFGTKKVARFFVDRGIWRMDRVCWPVVCDCGGRVIFVPGIGCDVAHWSRQSDVFMLKFEL